MRRTSFEWPLPSGQMQTMRHFAFDHIGEEIVLHAHDTFFHSSSILKGSVEVFDDTDKIDIFRKGETVGFPAGVRHGLRALELPTEVINMPEPGHNSHDG
jgi:quercetin dioxygenase-like cupin family protein